MIARISSIYPHPLTFLLVDDSSMMRRLIKKTLRRMDGTDIEVAEMLEADDGTEAWEALQSNSVDIIISDWNMPVMKGIELLEKVRASQAHAELPFLMVSAEAMTGNILLAASKGVSNYVTKPFTHETLRRKILMVLAKHYAPTDSLFE